jgi:signal transduction histidine kinase
MDALTITVVAAAVAVVVGFFSGRMTGRTRGGAISGAPARSSASGETSEADEAFRLALSRIGAYLRDNVDAPLAAAFRDRSLSLRRAAEDAVAAIDDLHFFLDDPVGEISEDDLTRIVKDAVQSYESEWDISVLFSSKGSVPVRVNPEALLDALYLILHNAAAFSDGKGIVSTVSSDGDWGRVLIQDEGPGFSAEALSRAYDPFYTTSEGGLGLGLSHARRAVELQAGRIHLRNRPEGGAEVEISVPLA